ncbi:3-phosphoshikimate 1-carboxyvinyltransferase [Desulfomonile tiedjei]|uniref:3-phosphoshikimate 1-carboxyvinyltransferase n=1 Tax=Desulfomonile tiedjei (strain ATCC 49306 / DSM 6799 / DCB-1) TaxID=706587 RepID=I4C397_DESTA|nr:3-phosphoshikimate 1-carboxyvinyltransferase [Desulfomonile tiedjei]AFM24038.1 3-phosphoshikimate 1-carboxyvinyltransferase [Desulfomonile tiedjei DSM 6799]
MKNELLKIHPSASLRGSVTLPGDKSLSHRALLLAALADGTSHIRNCLKAGVTEAMIECLQSLGVALEIENGAFTGSADLTITAQGMSGLTRPEKPLYCRGSATTLRLLAGVLAAQQFESTLDGNDRLRMRPMDRIVKPLQQKGAVIRTANGNAPLFFSPGRLNPSEHVLSVASAQVKSALLLSGLFTEGKTLVFEPHKSRDHTERMLRILGVPVSEWEEPKKGYAAEVTGPVERIPALDLKLPSDPSSAAFLVVAGLIVPDAELQLQDVCLNPHRTGLLDVLISMGANIRIEPSPDIHGEPTGNLYVKSSTLAASEIRGDTVTRMIDEFPIFAVAATQATGITVISDARELRLKESDRISAVAEELTKMEAKIDTKPDGLIIHGPVSLKGADVDARGDHRLAMSLAVAGLTAQGETTIRGWRVLEDSFPHFPEMLRNLGADVQW